MHDTGKVVAGLAIFGALASAPVWYGLARGGGQPPELPRPATAKQCVEPTAFMRARHMELLDRWRDAVVRGGDRVYVATDGHRWEMSLTRTCLRCHEDQDRFCNKCHVYAGVETFCFDCHHKKGQGAALAARSDGGAP